jgi:hypothetical protein
MEPVEWGNPEASLKYFIHIAKSSLFHPICPICP